MRTIKGKKIIVSLSIGRGVKNLLLTDLYRTLINDNHILILGDITNQPGFVKTFSHKNVEFIEDVSKNTNRFQSKITALIIVASNISDGILNAISFTGNYSARIRFLSYTLSRLNILFVIPIFFLGLMYLLTRRVRSFRTLLKKLITVRNPIYKLLHDWDPDLVILLTPTYPQDAIIGASCNTLGIRVALIPSSWDNVILSKEPLFDPDLVLSWSKNMSQLGQTIWDRRKGLVCNIGQLAFDEYDKLRPNSRSTFLHQHGLETGDTRIITYIAADDSSIVQQGEALLEIGKSILDNNENSLIIRHVSDEMTAEKLTHSTRKLPRVAHSFQHPAYSGNLEPSYKHDAPVQDYFNLLHHSDFFIASVPTMMMLEAANFGKHTILADFDKKYLGMGSAVIRSYMKALSLDNDAIRVIHNSNQISETIDQLDKSKATKKPFHRITNAWDVPYTQRSQKALETLEVFLNNPN